MLTEYQSLVIQIILTWRRVLTTSKKKHLYSVTAFCTYKICTYKFIYLKKEFKYILLLKFSFQPWKFLVVKCNLKAFWLLN